MKKLLMVSAMMLGIYMGSASAAPMVYTFKGTVNNHSRYSDTFTPEEFGVVPGKTKVTYSFLVDFDRSVSTHTNATGTWKYFYNDLLSGGILNGEHPESNIGYNFIRTSWYNFGTLYGGSHVSIIASESEHPDHWRVKDWYIGQAFRFIDSGYFSGRGEFYLFGEVELINISHATSVPENLHRFH